MDGVPVPDSWDFPRAYFLGMWSFTLFGNPTSISRSFCGTLLHRRPASGKNWDRTLPGIPSALLQTFADAGVDQFRFFPGNIVIAGLQKRASRIPQPLMWKERNRVLFGELGSRLYSLVRNGCIQSCRQIPPGAERQVSHLRRAGIDLYQVRISRVRLKHEIKPVHSGEVETADNFFGSARHFSILNQAHHCGWSRRTPLVKH